MVHFLLRKKKNMSAAKGHSVVCNKHHLPSLVNPQRAGRLTNHLQYLEHDVIEELWNHECSGPFLFPVDPFSLPVREPTIKTEHFGLFFENAFKNNSCDLSSLSDLLRGYQKSHGPEHNQKEAGEPVLPPWYGMCSGHFINIHKLLHIP